MEKLLLSAEQAREVTSTRGYEWTKNQVFKGIRTQAEKGLTYFFWNFNSCNDFELKDFENMDLITGCIERDNIVKLIRVLREAYNYKVKFSTTQHSPSDDLESTIVTGITISW